LRSRSSQSWPSQRWSLRNIPLRMAHCWSRWTWQIRLRQSHPARPAHARSPSLAHAQRGGTAGKNPTRYPAVMPTADPGRYRQHEVLLVSRCRELHASRFPGCCQHGAPQSRGCQQSGRLRAGRSCPASGCCCDARRHREPMRQAGPGRASPQVPGAFACRLQRAPARPDARSAAIHCRRRQLPPGCRAGRPFFAGCSCCSPLRACSHPRSALGYPDCLALPRSNNWPVRP